MKHLCKLLFATLLILAGCTKDGDDGITPPPPSQNPDAPIVDMVLTTYGGKVAILTNGDNLVTYLLKRFNNTTAQLNTDIEAVLLDETAITDVVGNTEHWAILKKLWSRNKALVIVNPGQNALNMLAKLRADAFGLEHKGVNDDVVASYGNTHLYITTASGDAMLYQRMNKQYREGVITSYGKEYEDDEPNVSSYDYDEVVNYEPTDYEMGRMAEAASRWLNENNSVELKRTPLDSSIENNSGNKISITYYTTISVSHDMAYDYKWCRVYEDYPRSKSTEATTRISVTAGYSEELEADVYDVVLHQYFNGGESMVPFYIVWEHLSYNWRYSGGYYYGPTVDVKLKGSDSSSFSVENNTELLSPAPVPAAGSYNISHNPSTVSFSGGITGGASVGSSGLEGSVSGNFGFMVSLPSTTVSEVVSEMPLMYEASRDALKWTFRTNWDLHKIHWPTNPDFSDPPLITQTGCNTSQAVAFVVYNSKSLGTDPLYIDYRVDYKTFHELGRAEIENHDAFNNWSTTDKYQELISHIVQLPTLQLPTIPRYFRDYTPSCIYTDGAADGDGGWSSLEEMLNDNIYYKTFEGDDKIRSVTEEGLNDVAEEAWRETLTSLIANYSGMKTESSYIVALAYDTTKHLSLGLYIHDGIWEIIEDVDKKKEELLAQQQD